MAYLYVIVELGFQFFTRANEEQITDEGVRSSLRPMIMPTSQGDNCTGLMMNNVDVGGEMVG